MVTLKSSGGLKGVGCLLGGNWLCAMCDLSLDNGASIKGLNSQGPVVVVRQAAAVG